jgi:hypothetical protein
MIAKKARVAVVVDMNTIITHEQSSSGFVFGFYRRIWGGPSAGLEKSAGSARD